MFWKSAIALLEHHSFLICSVNSKTGALVPDLSGLGHTSSALFEWNLDVGDERVKEEKHSSDCCSLFAIAKRSSVIKISESLDVLNIASSRYSLLLLRNKSSASRTGTGSLDEKNSSFKSSGNSSDDNDDDDESQSPRDFPKIAVKSTKEWAKLKPINR